MANLKKTIKRIVIILVLLPVLYLAVVIILGMITDYNPPEKEIISSIDDGFYVNDTTIFSALTWNIGYAGLGSNMDFFYDGGTRVRDSLFYANRNLGMITSWLADNDSINFMLLQEVDLNSKRSYFVDQRNKLTVSLGSHFPFFAFNFKVKFVPIPFLEPMGKVESGIMIYSEYVPQLSTRYSLPGKYSWPKQLFTLDGCMLVNRYKIENSTKELLIINSHFEAYDGGQMRKEQMDYLQKLLLDEERKGNYFVVGADWNQSPPDINTHIDGYVFDTIHLVKVPTDFCQPGWKIVYDSTQPSNRWLDMPFDKEKNGITIIDFFLTSANIEVLTCKTQPSGFNYSDHQPVILQFKLKK